MSIWLVRESNLALTMLSLVAALFAMFPLSAIGLQRLHIQPQVWVDLRSNHWAVRRDAFEHLVSMEDTKDIPRVQDSMIRLLEKEDVASQRGEAGERDLFEDDDYLAYLEQLTDRVESIAVKTNRPAAWRALVNERYNYDSRFADWLAAHRASLPYVVALFHNRHSWYRGIASYVLASMLAKSKTDHPFTTQEYGRYKRLIRWHVLHDHDFARWWAIDGLALTNDPEDLSFLQKFAAQSHTPFDKDLALKAAQSIRAVLATPPH